MAINVSAAAKTGVVVLAVWGFMLASDISRHGASWLHLGSIGQSAASADSYGLTMSDNAVKPAGAPDGPLVVSVEPNSAADKQGVQANDVIMGVNRMKTRDSGKVLEWLERGEGQMRFQVWRNGQTIVLHGKQEAQASAKQATVQNQPTAPATPAPPVDPDKVGLRLADMGQPEGAPLGPVVAEVEEGGKAATAGLQVNDVIVSVNRIKVRYGGQVSSHIEAGGAVKLVVWRGGQELPITIERGGKSSPAAPVEGTETQSAADRVFGQINGSKIKH